MRASLQSEREEERGGEGERERERERRCARSMARLSGACVVR